jgi:hypothetical protein
MRSIAGYLCVLLMLIVMPGASGAKLPASCGPRHSSVHVIKKSGGKLPGVAAGDARLVFVQDQGFCYGCSAMQIGVDGKWVGMNQGKSWFAVTVPPGEQHVCAWMKARVMAFGFVGTDHRVALASVDAKAGKTYYFETRIGGSSQPRTILRKISKDQGKFVAANAKETITKFRNRG